MPGIGQGAGGLGLRLVLSEYTDHSNTHHPHRAPDQDPPAGRAHPPTEVTGLFRPPGRSDPRGAADLAAPLRARPARVARDTTGSWPRIGGDHGPEPIRAAASHRGADLPAPEVGGAELGPPGPQPTRPVVRRVLLRHPDRAMGLVAVRGDDRGRLIRDGSLIPMEK